MLPLKVVNNGLVWGQHYMENHDKLLEEIMRGTAIAAPIESQFGDELQQLVVACIQTQHASRPCMLDVTPSLEKLVEVGIT